MCLHLCTYTYMHCTYRLVVNCKKEGGLGTAALFEGLSSEAK